MDDCNARMTSSDRSGSATFFTDDVNGATTRNGRKVFIFDEIVEEVAMSFFFFFT